MRSFLLPPPFPAAFPSYSRENDVYELHDLGEALSQGADAALVCEVRQRRDVQTHVVDPENVDGSHLPPRGGNAKKRQDQTIPSLRKKNNVTCSVARAGHPWWRSSTRSGAPAHLLPRVLVWLESGNKHQTR